MSADTSLSTDTPGTGTDLDKALLDEVTAVVRAAGDRQIGRAHV